MSRPDGPPSPSLAPLMWGVLVASVVSLIASLVLILAAQRIATTPSPAAARADSLARVTESLRRQLVVERGRDRPIDSIDPFEIEDLKARGLAAPVDSLKADLARHPELIPYPGVLGGNMGFYSPTDIHVLDGRWVFARFDDGHVGGDMLLEYTVKDGRITWRRVKVAHDD